MVYIYKKIVQGRTYYYLRISERSGKRVITKDIAYLGSSIEQVKKELEKLKTYKDDIRKAHKTIKKFIDSNYYMERIQKEKIKKNEYLSLGLFEQVEAARLHYLNKFKKLDETTKISIYESFLIDFAYNTTSIEGNTITLEEGKKLLTENLTPRDRTMREIFDLQNTKKLFFNLLKTQPRINEKLIRDIHDGLLENIDIRKGYRIHEIRVFKSHFEATPPVYIQADMKILLEWYQSNKKLHPLVLAGMFHQKFEKIHPFSEGNGRTGRILLNYMLLKKGYPPLIVQKKNRSEYLAALHSADKSGLKGKEAGYFKPLIEYLAQECVGSYWNNFLV